MKQVALVIIKPDGVSKGLTGNVINKFAQAELEIIAVRMAKASRKVAEEHYKHLKDTPFFGEVIDYLLGKYHNSAKLIILVYYGKQAIKKCREIAGATNPEEAGPLTIRGTYGRITTGGIYENVVHVSSDKEEAEREIKLWFKPDEMPVELYPTKTKLIKEHRERIWA